MTLQAPDFAYVTQLVRQRSSIDLQPGKEYLVESRLATVVREVGERDISGLVARMRSGDSKVAALVVDALTTNETSWFRDSHPFQAVSQHLLPEIAKSGARSLTIWSAASSSGQEAYSLAMLLLDWLPLNPGVRAQIIGTDISPTMVERARAGKYSQLEVNRGLPAQYLVKHFEQVGRDWVLRPEVRSLARFETGNLALPPPPSMPACDIVFLRNVLIYFDMETKRTVLANIRRVLRPGGYLLLGGAESTLNLDAAFQRTELGRAVVFRHTGGAA